MNEIWLPVPGFVGCYEVSSAGRVRSLDRLDRLGRRRAGRILRAKPGSNGYPSVTLAADKDGRRPPRSVHVLVLEAFVGPRPEGTEARHLNDDPTDNRLENLAWGTPSDNARDRVRNGHDADSRKTRCPRGHLLLGQNLRASQLVRGKRACRSCQNALSYVRAHGGDVDAIADDYYRKYYT